jgi:hypothetical protein
MVTKLETPTPTRSTYEARHAASLTVPPMWSKVLLGSGIAASALYVVTDVIASQRYPGYSYTDNTFSELAAQGAPTRPLVLGTIILGIPLFAAFAGGVWRSVGPNRIAGVAAVMLLGYEASGAAAQLFFPMKTRGASVAGEGTLRNALHPPMTMVSVIFLLLAVVFASKLLGTRFRYYSYATIAILLVFGVLSGLQGGRAEANLPTPWIGLEQRINAYVFMLWIAVLAIGLLRRGNHLAEMSGTSTVMRWRGQ